MTQEAAEQLVEKSWHHLAWPILLVIALTVGAQFLDNTFLIMFAIGVVLLGFISIRAFKDHQLMGILLLAGGFAGFAMGLASSITKVAVTQQLWLIFGIISEPFVLATVGVLLGIGLAFIVGKIQPLFERG